MAQTIEKQRCLRGEVLWRVVTCKVWGTCKTFDFFEQIEGLRGSVGGLLFVIVLPIKGDQPFATEVPPHLGFYRLSGPIGVIKNNFTFLRGVGHLVFPGPGIGAP